MSPSLGPYKRIFLMVVFDSIILFLLTWLVTVHRVPILPAAIVVYPLMLITNFIYIRRLVLKPDGPRTRSYPKFRVPIFGAIVFTAACIVQIIYWVKDPDVRSTVQVAIGLMLSSYSWYLVRSIRRLNKDQE